jgi:alkyldihydroxyacetonephosphate synthase
MELCRAIRDAVGVEVSERAPDRLSYARDLWPRHHIAVRDRRLPETRPAAIAWPENSDDVARLVRFCAGEGIAVVPFGAGSGVCAGVLPTPRTLVIDLKRMTRWRRFAPEEGYLEVEAGALGIRLEEDLQARGYTIGHFPSSILCSTVGGWIAARGAGQCSGLYGKIEDMTATIECVDGRGELATLRRRRNGPDLTPLLVGSEGVLAVMTAARLRLHDKPEVRAPGAFSFGSMEAGWEAIRAIYQEGLRPAVCRLYDPFDSMMARRSERKERGAHAPKKGGASLRSAAMRGALRLPSWVNGALDALGTRAFGGALLVLVFEGAGQRPAEGLAAARQLVARRGAEDLGDGPARHWLDHRYAVSYRQAPTFMAGAFVDTMEVAAPWSRLGALYRAVHEALSDRVMVMAHMSHAYPDGCSIYFTFAGSAPDAADAERIYDGAWRSAMAAAIGAGGTLSHHHGVGRSKAPAMGAELGLGVTVCRALRDAFDPEGVLNPGNLLPPEDPPALPLPPAPAAPELDMLSQTVHAAGAHKVGDVERAIRAARLTLGAPPEHHGLSVAEWLGAGAPGAPDGWLDPVDHLVAGYAVELPRGGALSIRPCPRRAVGPDLWCLFSGTRVGRIHAVHLRARGPAPRALETPLERDPAIDEPEQRMIDRALRAVVEL